MKTLTKKSSLQEIQDLIETYKKSRNGEFNENTESEAMFVFISNFGGMYILHTGYACLWIGLQNASARWSNNGKPFDSVYDAIEAVINAKSPIYSKGEVIYSESVIELMRYLAAENEKLKGLNKTMICTD